MSQEAIATMNPYIIILGLLAILNLLGFVAMSMFIWIAKSAIRDLRKLEDTIDDIRDDHEEFKAKVNDEFVKDKQYYRDINEIKTTLKHIWKATTRPANQPGGSAG